MSVCLVTSTFYPSTDDMRFQLALKTAEEAKKAGYQLIVVDGSPEPKVASELSDRGAVVYKEEKRGMGNSRRQCLNLGIKTGAQVIVWLEPEKHPIVPLLLFCIELVKGYTFNMVIPRRKTFKNYPKYQHYSELWANSEAANITGRPDLDLWMGPRVMDRETAEIMMSYKGERGDNWEILFVPVLRMLHMGMEIGSVTVDYVHPLEQLVEDDEAMRDKRDKQRIDLLRAMKEEAETLFFRPILNWPTIVR